MTHLRRWQWVCFVVASAWSTVFVFHGEPVSAQVNREDLRPGLVATYRDGAGVAHLQLDSAMALALKVGEAAHPRLAATGGSITWEGYLNVFRPSDYVFSALLRGKFQLTVDGKEILRGDGNGVSADLVEGKKIKLAAGAYPLRAEFTRLPGDARLEVYWQAPIFIKEPLPLANLRHLPAKAPELLTHDRNVDRGRFLVEEFSCARCHVPAGGDKMSMTLDSREGPNLAQVGQRYHAKWIYNWLKNPQAMSPAAAMPRLFSDDDQGRTEIYAVTRYLESLGAPVKEAKQPKNVAESIKRGKQLFSLTGCVVCHPLTNVPAVAPEAPLLHHLASLTGPAREFPLPDQSGKTTPTVLAAYLLNPHKTDPSGRMPQVVNSAKDAEDLANYLCLSRKISEAPTMPEAPDAGKVREAFFQIEKDEAARAAFAKLGEDARLKNLGQRLLGEHNCLACHSLQIGKPPAPAKVSKFDFEAIKQSATRKNGCLAENAQQRGSAPLFGIGEDRAAIRLFLAEGTKGAGSPSPTFSAMVALQRFNCLACHNRDGEGGLTAQATDELRKYEKAENGEATSPPTLSGVGHKLRTSWFRAVLTQGGRSRPWMGLRMPQFGEAHVGHLAEAMAALEGATADDKPHVVPMTPETIKVGRQLIGKNNGYGCISCHDIAGVPNGGTRGPDLALTSQHVRYDWYRRWLESAQRMDPGTKMPSIILDGRTMLDAVLSGNANAQAEAMWAYLSVGPTLQLPEGLEPPKGLIIAVKDRPSLLRTFMPDAGNKAIAVGYPDGVSTVFDAVQCRLAYGWNGSFLDASPVWANRGGAPAKVLGPKFWAAPQGFPWGLSDAKPPDFTAIAKDPAYGAAMPEGVVFQGQKQLFFEGYKLDSQGQPSFQYRIGPDKKKSVAIEEQPVPLRGAIAVGVARRMDVQNNAHRDLWMHVLNVPDGSKKVRVVDSKGKDLELSLKDGTALATGDRLFVVPKGEGEGDSFLVVSAATPPGVEWQWQGTDLLLRFNRDVAHAAIVVRIWSIPRADGATLREILEVK
jgi:mono/diheme cytochrome c family protein